MMENTLCDGSRYILKPIFDGAVTIPRCPCCGQLFEPDIHFGQARIPEHKTLDTYNKTYTMITLPKPAKPTREIRPSNLTLSSFTVQVPYDMALQLKKIDPFAVRAALAQLLKQE